MTYEIHKMAAFARAIDAIGGCGFEDIEKAYTILRKAGFDSDSDLADHKFSNAFGMQMAANAINANLSFVGARAKVISEQDSTCLEVTIGLRKWKTAPDVGQLVIMFARYPQYRKRTLEDLAKRILLSIMQQEQPKDWKP